MRGDGGVAGEWRVVGIPKLMSNASSGLCIILGYIILQAKIYLGSNTLEFSAIHRC